jgi:hypothetical protein
MNYELFEQREQKPNLFGLCRVVKIIYSERINYKLFGYQLSEPFMTFWRV